VVEFGESTQHRFLDDILNISIVLQNGTHAVLALAREFVGTQDPLNFFRSWKTPAERYIPLSMQKAAAKQD
jgi:hypothetical protein